MEELAHSGKPEPTSTETAVKLNDRGVTPRPYQRKVKLSLTRYQANLLHRAMLRLSADPVARANAGVGDERAAMRTCKLIWRSIDTAIAKRDRAQRIKEGIADHLGNTIKPIDENADTPLF